MYIFDALTGRILENGIVNLEYKVKHVFLLNHQTDSHLNPLCIIDESNQVHIYPEDAKSVVVKLKHDLFFYVADKQTNSIIGYTLSYISNKVLFFSKIV